MKKLTVSFVKKVFAYVSLSALSIVLFFSCGDDSGLGKAVDLTPPIIKITSHVDNDTVASGFMLQGTASDNEGVSSITIDCEAAELHYQVSPGGVWKKNSVSTDGWENVADSEGSCTSIGENAWAWSVYINTEEDAPDYADTTYAFSALAIDKMENSGSDSKVDISLIVDKNNPDVTVSSPDLFKTARAETEEKIESYRLQDGNIISRLLNGNIVISGRQSGSIAFKELRIEFDDGGLAASSPRLVTTSDGYKNIDGSKGVDYIAENAPFENDTKTKVYYSKTLKKGENGITDLRNWELTITPDDWISDEKNSEFKTGKHLIRMVSTSVSPANAWERKVLGYFVWWQEADKPWLVTYTGDEEDKGDTATAIYPSSNITGTAHDDDGIASLVYTLEQKNDDGEYELYENNVLALSQEGATYSAWAVKAPVIIGSYRLTVTVTDLYGASAELVRYFKTLDIQPPKITFDDTCTINALDNADGTVTFTGTVSDDGTVKSFMVAYLNPALVTDSDNKIRYLSNSSSDADWSKATVAGDRDTYGNILYTIDLDTPTYDGSLNTYKFTKTFNLFSDLGIDGTTRKLVTQDFVFRAIDNGNTSTTQMYSLHGDTTAPTISVDTLQVFDANGNSVLDAYTFTDSASPTLPAIDTGYYAIVTGTWSDNSATIWGTSPLRMQDITVTWGNNGTIADNGLTMIDGAQNADGTWTWKAQIRNLPTVSASIIATIKDYGGNEKKASRSVFANNTESALEGIGCENDDGAYKAGERITLTLLFSKDTEVSGGTPTLTLNNGATATYVGYLNGNKSIHEFTYEVKSGEDIEKLDITEINTNGANWTDGAKKVAVLLPETKLSASRNITIDTVAPTVQSVTAITSAGYYKENAPILLMLTFNEDVTVTGSTTNLKLALNTGTSITTNAAVMSGSRLALFTYNVENGHNANPLKITSLVHDDVIVTDEAGNNMTDWALRNISLDSIVIDTTAPKEPVISTAWGSDSMVFEETYFEINTNGETDIDYIEYTTNNLTWQTYTGKVDIKNNGTYYIAARQTDKAGNISNTTALTTVVMNKGALLTRISASTVNGTYSTNTTTKKIEGYIQFRLPVAIATGATVTLNVKNGSTTTKTCALAGSNDTMTDTKFLFTYVITEGDSIDANDDLLDVIDWSFDTVTVQGNKVRMTVTDDAYSGEGKRFKENREIKIVTGKPSVTKTPTLTGEGTEAVLTVTFDRDITKYQGEIIFEQETGYKAPLWLTTSDYNELSSNSTIKNAYSKDINGATKDGNYLVPDTSTKYVLNFTTEPDNTALVNAFKAVNKHKVSIPVVAGEVSTKGKTLTVMLGSAYALPIKGASYTLTLPDGMVVDAVQNQNASYSNTVTAEGIESPVIRIKKESYTISNAGKTTSATVKMQETATVRMDTRTPGATILYDTNTKTNSTNVAHVNKSPQFYTTETANVTVPSTYTKTYNSTFTLGSTNLYYKSNTDTNLSALKIAIVAIAKKGTVTSTPAYAYAARTVLKLMITGESDSGSFDVTDSEESGLKSGDLKVWVIGGDAPYGGNTIDTFPLAWNDSSKFKLMSGSFYNTSNLLGYFYWATWDISTNTYHGFAIGDVPSDAATNGPKVWYVGECAWVAQKENYVLYPGEMLEMAIESGNNASYQAKFLFREKNKGTR